MFGSWELVSIRFAKNAHLNVENLISMNTFDENISLGILQRTGNLFTNELFRISTDPFIVYIYYTDAIF